MNLPKRHAFASSLLHEKRNGRVNARSENHNHVRTDSVLHVSSFSASHADDREIVNVARGITQVDQAVAQYHARLECGMSTVADALTGRLRELVLNHE